IYNWLKKPSWKEVYDDVRESLLDLTESRQLLLIKGLMKLDENGNFIGWIERPSEQMIIWFEKTRGKHRGLTEKTEQELTVNASVPIRKWLEESRKERAKKEKNKK
ncbi:MAG: hypothetical protein REI93_11870, partial [Pedobacter sp.]|nr:hypothetical protein [Pedobacter sp.]